MHPIARRKGDSATMEVQKLKQGHQAQFVKVSVSVLVSYKLRVLDIVQLHSGNGWR